MQQTLPAYVMHVWREILAFPVVKFFVSLAITAFGEYRQALGALVVFMGFDLILGMMKAAQRGQLRPSTAREKTFVKFGIYCGMGIAAGLFDAVVLGTSINIAGTVFRLVPIAITYLAATELLSVISNLEEVTHSRITLPGLAAVRKWRDGLEREEQGAQEVEAVVLEAKPPDAA